MKAWIAWLCVCPAVARVSLLAAPDTSILAPRVYRNSALAIDFLSVSFGTQSNPRSGYAFLTGSDTPLEFSPDLMPPHRVMEAARRTAQNAVGSARTLGEPTLLYLGMGQYVAQFPVLADGKELLKVSVCLRNQQIVDAQIGVVAFKAKPRLNPGKPLSWMSAWSGQRFRIASAGTKLIGVPVYPYHLNDGATAVAMALSFWERQGIAGLRLPSPSEPSRLESDREFITQLTAAGCHCLFDQTVAKFGATRGFQITTQFASLPAEPGGSKATFEWYCNQVEAGRPVLIAITTQGLKHTAVGVGHCQDSTGKYMVVKDPGFAGEPVPAEWATAMEPTAQGVICYNWEGIYDRLELTAIHRPHRADRN